MIRTNQVFFSKSLLDDLIKFDKEDAVYLVAELKMYEDSQIILEDHHVLKLRDDLFVLTIEHNHKTYIFYITYDNEGNFVFSKATTLDEITKMLNKESKSKSKKRKRQLKKVTNY